MRVLQTLFRSLVFYAVALICVRLMGKREIGELSPFDLVVAIMLGELVVIPVHDRSISYLDALVPVVFLVVAEILLSVISMKNRKAREIINDTPMLLMKDGIILEEAMRKARYTNDELLIELRQNGIRSPEEVEFAILEPGGHISVFPKSKYRPLTPHDLGIEPKKESLPIHVVNDGEILDEALPLANITREELLARLARAGYDDPRDVFFACIDTDGEMYVSPRQQRSCALEKKSGQE